MSIFKSLTTTGIEQAKDSLGESKFAPLDSGVYETKIKLAYAGKSEGGASSVTFIFDLGTREYTETLYVTNRNGVNYYEKDGKKFPLPGFTTVDDLCLVASGAPLAEQETEEKVIQSYDFEAKKDMPKRVPVLMALLNKPVTIAIKKTLVNKKTKDANGNYVDIADSREENNIAKVFHTETRLTVLETQNNATEAVFHDAWAEKNTGKTADKRKIKEDSAKTSSTSTARKSLFS